ncbi:MAG TPA: hypothetical protein VJ717_18655 [Gemmatimonadaceae bacterium]|nr:hypothetical protein [Gemmatimonadaceae bacterium]
MRKLLARALGILVGALGLALVWNGLRGLAYTDTAPGFAVLALDLLAGLALIPGGYWLWRREQRALRITTIGMLIAVTAGMLAAWHYAEAERANALIGAAAAGIVLTVAIGVFARVALKAPAPDEQLSLFSSERD